MSHSWLAAIFYGISIQTGSFESYMEYPTILQWYLIQTPYYPPDQIACRQFFSARSYIIYIILCGVFKTPTIYRIAYFQNHKELSLILLLCLRMYNSSIIIVSSFSFSDSSCVFSCIFKSLSKRKRRTTTVT